MGRLATNLAAKVANADNLPPKDQLPQVSIFDAVLPKSFSNVSPIKERKVKSLSHHSVESEVKNGKADPTVKTHIAPYLQNVHRDHKGNKVMVRRKNGSRTGSAAKEGEGERANGRENRGKNGNGRNGAGENNNNGGGASGGEGKWDQNAPLTAEEEAKLKEMKAAENSWKQIVAEIQRPKKVLQARWKEIEAEAGGDEGAEAKKNEGGKKGGNAEGGKKKGSGEKAGGNNEKKNNNNNAEKKKEEAKKREDKKETGRKAKAPSKSGSAARSNGPARFTMQEWQTLQEDTIFSFTELQCLSELMMRDDREKWLRIASAFYDKTGRRVHRDDIRDKFYEMRAMGSQR